MPSASDLKERGIASGVVGKILAMALPLLMGSLSKNLGKNMAPEIFQSCWESNLKWLCPLHQTQQELCRSFPPLRKVAVDYWNGLKNSLNPEN